MKLLCCVALLLSGACQAGELLPTAGEDADELQDAIDETLAPAVAALPDGITVEPIIEAMRIAGRAKRIFLGPLARGSFLTLRVKVTDSAGSQELIISDESNAWKGTVRPGTDYDMIERVMEKAVEFVHNYRPNEAAQHNPSDDRPVGVVASPAMPATD